MEEHGLIARSAHPRHPNALELRLTDVGRDTVRAARRLAEPIERRLDNAIPPQDAAVLTELLARVIDASAPD